MKLFSAFSICLSLLLGTLHAVELQPIRHSKFKIKARIDARHSIADITSVSFYITRDNGANWSQVAADKVQQQAGDIPYFIFQSQGDGSYGFWPQVFYNDGSSDIAPRSGTMPLNGAVKLIDTTPPQIESFIAGLLTGTGSKLVIEWEVSDLHLPSNPVDIEYSSDLETWTHLIHDQAAKNSYVGALPNKLQTCYLRLSVSDRAHNKTHSKIVQIGHQTVVDTPSLTPPPTTSAPEKKQPTAKNTETSSSTVDTPSTLPSLKEVGAAVNKELAHTDANNKELPPKKFAIPPGHQDIVAPYANKPWPKSFNESNATENENPELADKTNGASDNTQAQLNSKVINAEIARILYRRKDRLIFGTDAEKVLAAARHAVALGTSNHALVLYQRLHNSTVTAEALPEEIALLIGLKRLTQAMTVLKNAPPESITSAMRVQEAQLLLAQKKTTAAINVLHSIIPDNTDAFKNSRLILARSYISIKKIKFARPILIDLSKNNDTWGQTAQRLLQSLP